MSQYQISKLLRDIARDVELARVCQTDLPAVLGNYALDDSEETALREWDLRRLYEMGINPLLLLTSSMALGKDIGAYVAALNAKG